MSGLELAGLVMGALGPLEQTTKVVSKLRAHFKSFSKNEELIDTLINTFNHLQYDLNQLEPQLRKYQSSIPKANGHTFQTRLIRMDTTFRNMKSSLSEMETLAVGKFEYFWKASKWAERCRVHQQELEEAQECIFQISCFLHSNEILSNIKSTVEQTKHGVKRVENLVQVVDRSKDSSLTTTVEDEFRASRQKLPFSRAAVPDFNSTSSDGKPSTIEGKLKYKLLDTTVYQIKIFALQGSSGVGKTTILHMLSHDGQLRRHFSDGLYYIKLGANASLDTLTDQLADIVRKSGGVRKSEEIRTKKDIENAISITSEWFAEKSFLLLVDDIWEKQEGLGKSLVSFLEQIVICGKVAGMVFTTRDPSIAFSGKVYPVRPRELEESRNILLRHAQQEDKVEFSEQSETAIMQLLSACGGLPVAHAVVGRGVLQYSLIANVGKDYAWMVYASKRDSILEGAADGYGSLWSIFETAVRILDEDSWNMESEELAEQTYSFREMHRALHVLEKQQCMPLQTLRCLWKIDSEELVRKVCTNFVRVGLIDWHYQVVEENRGIECISMHDHLHNFATASSEKEEKMQLWHTRIVEEYSDRNELNDYESHGCREWWTAADHWYEKDGGYLLKNICRHLCVSIQEKTEIVTLVTRPQWISMQLKKHGILQIERDMSFAFQYIESIERNSNHVDEPCEQHGENRMKPKDLMMIRDAVRLAVSFVTRNPTEVWFQLYGRLRSTGDISDGIKEYLKYLEVHGPKPWIRPNLKALTQVGTRANRIINVGSEIHCMVVLAGGVEALCGCENGKIVLLNLKETNIKKQWLAHNNRVLCMTMSTGENFLVSGSEDETAKIWETGSWDEIGKLEEYSAANTDIRISRDEKYVFLANREGVIRIWNITERSEGYSKCTDMGDLRTMELQNNEDRFVVHSDKAKLFCWTIRNHDDENEPFQQPAVDASTLRIIRNIVNVIDDVSCIQMNEDGSKMIIMHEDRSVQISDISTMRSIGDRWIGHDDPVESAALNTDITKIVFGHDDRTIEVRNVQTGELECDPFHGHLYNITGVSFIEEGNSIVSCSWDKTVRVWEIGELTSKESPGDQLDRGTWCVRFSPDESQFITGHNDGRLCVWDTRTERLMRESSKIHETYVFDVAITPDGTFIISVGVDKEVKVTNFETLELIKTFFGHDRFIMSVDISRSGKYAVTGSLDNTVRIWDLQKCDGSHKIIETGDSVFGVFITQDEQRIICTLRNSIQIWNVECQERIDEIHDPKAWTMTKEDAMGVWKEPELNDLEKECRMFCRGNENELRYGTALSSKVVGTMEHAIHRFVYSALNKTVCIKMSPDKVAVLKIEF